MLTNTERLTYTVLSSGSVEEYVYFNVLLVLTEDEMNTFAVQSFDTVDENTFCTFPAGTVEEYALFTFLACGSSEVLVGCASRCVEDQAWKCRRDDSWSPTGRARATSKKAWRPSVWPATLVVGHAQRCEHTRPHRPPPAAGRRKTNTGQWLKSCVRLHGAAVVAAPLALIRC